MFGPAASFFNVLPQLAPIAAPSIFDLPFCLTPIVGGRDVQNIEHNPSVEVNVVDPLVRKGYRFKGRGMSIALMKTSSAGARCTGTRDSPLKSEPWS